jgi:maltooligosyltrehalose trehalohydrolase
MTAPYKRRLPVGAEIAPGGVHFRVWAPKRERVDVVIGHTAHALERENDGYFSGLVEDARAGTRYKLRLDGVSAFPDPASRHQPEGPHAASAVVDASTFKWSDAHWKGVDPKRLLLYEMHVGTFTRQGTFQAAAKQLQELADLGVSCIEMMPVAEFAGSFGWGYDGVDWFAPYHVYGAPDDLRSFVDRAHDLGIGVILDVVYNHFGPDGNYLREFSDDYFSARHKTDWGDALNYDGPNSGPVRELVLANVRHWIEEYHFDGLRLDATDNIYDDSEPHLLRQIGETARATARARSIVLLCENEAQEERLTRSADEGGHGLDLVWSDDFHHTALVALTGRREAYFMDYRGTPQELISAARHGYLYQGQRYRWQKQRRGTQVWNRPAYRFVHYLENHDQVANTRDGRRLHQLTSPGRFRALTALLLLGPQTPLLFQGQEYGSSARFLYFADHHEELRVLVRKGRGEFLAQFASIAAQPDGLDDPGAPETFVLCRLDESERREKGPIYALHRDLISLRQCDPVLSSGAARVEGAVLGEAAFVLRFFAEDGNDRLLVVNLGVDLALDVAPEPLLASPDQQSGWTRVWHSEEPCYGGRGAASPESEDGSWQIPAESATLLASGE